MARHDTKQVCLNGHWITDRFYNSPHQREDHCSHCGAETITECQNCGEEIQGKDLDSGVAVIGFGHLIPDYCNDCGEPFPWTQQPDEEELIEMGVAIEQGESERIEFKEELDSPRDISKELVALANHQGGILLLGIDDPGVVMGLEDAKGTEERISGHVRSTIDPSMNPTIRIENIGGEDVLSIQAPEADGKPYNLNGTFYIRTGTGTDKLSSDELADWFN